MKTSLMTSKANDNKVAVMDGSRSPGWPATVDKMDPDMTEAVSTTRLDADRILDHLEYFRRVKKDADATEERRKEWVEVGNILDRGLLFLFLIFTLITAVVLFGIYPLSKADLPAVLD